MTLVLVAATVGCSNGGGLYCGRLESAFETPPPLSEETGSVVDTKSSENIACILDDPCARGQMPYEF
uniref:Lipoprotein n=1 Tax=Angiostrongylus cantonensis TaxID=6313 RepID=A0A0K0DKE5_ANGCA